MNTIRHAKLDGLYSLSRKRAWEVLNGYGFVEISDALNFLQLMCGNELDLCEMAYLRKKIETCLKLYDDRSDYFISLREFVTEIDCLSHIKYKIIKL